MKIFTLAYNRADMIEPQLKSLKKWVKDFEYTVYDNCLDDSVRNECVRLGVKCLPIQIFNSDPSWCVGLSLNKIWEGLQKEKGILMYIDSDMFLIGKLPEMKDYDFAFVPQVRGRLVYPWTGLMMFNMDTLSHPEELKWQVDYSIKTDVGGLNYFYLKEHKPRVLELVMWTLLDKDEYSYNGVDTQCQATQFKLMEEMFKSFPRPYALDLFQVKGQSFRECFVFHFKSASSYPSFMTPEYNRMKTRALLEYL